MLFYTIAIFWIWLYALLLRRHSKEKFLHYLAFTPWNDKKTRGFLMF